MRTLEALKDARDRIADPAHWTHGTSAKDAHGCSVSPLDQAAVKWCAGGSMNRSTEELGTDDIRPYEFLTYGTKRVAAEEGLTTRLISQVNDICSHSGAMRMYDVAIERATQDA